MQTQQTAYPTQSETAQELLHQKYSTIPHALPDHTGTKEAIYSSRNISSAPESMASYQIPQYSERLHSSRGVPIAGATNRPIASEDHRVQNESEDSHLRTSAITTAGGGGINHPIQYKGPPQHHQQTQPQQLLPNRPPEAGTTSVMEADLMALRQMTLDLHTRVQEYEKHSSREVHPPPRGPHTFSSYTTSIVGLVTRLTGYLIEVCGHFCILWENMDFLSPHFEYTCIKMGLPMLWERIHMS